MSVDLPAPLSPTRAVTEPAGNSIVTSRTASTPPNDFQMARAASSGWEGCAALDGASAPGSAIGGTSSAMGESVGNGRTAVNSEMGLAGNVGEPHRQGSRVLDAAAGR